MTLRIQLRSGRQIIGTIVGDDGDSIILHDHDPRVNVNRRISRLNIAWVQQIREGQ